ncbi:MAG: LCP family protein [Anaerolineales bacterium]|nr:LCP family protein [Anaerolineales bacterium]
MSEKKFDFKNLKRPSGGQLILLAVGLLMAVALFIFMRGFIACWQLTSLPGIPPPSCGISAANPRVTPGANSEGTPVAPASSSTSIAPQVQLPPPWDGASRVTILVIGLDYRDWVAGEGPPRSDTMMLLTIDPLSKTAGMLSIPRDMWVNIPGSSYAKINTAYALGEAYKLPGGGPGLAMKTVENFLGVTINYYAQIDFNAFERMIDEIGGLDLEVSETITLDPLGQHNTVYDLPPGNYHFDGPMVLAYSRSRDTEGGDVDRANRQQQVIFAIRDKVLSLNMLPMLVAKAPALYQELSAGIHTNLALEDAVRLGVLGVQIPPSNIKKGVIDYSMMTIGVSPDNLDIFKPIPDKIRVLRDEVFGGGALSPLATGDQAQILKDEEARVVVLNTGSGITGLAQSASDYLTSQGVNVVLIGNTIDHPEFPIFYYAEGRTTVVDYSGKPYALRHLMSTMGLSSGQIRIKYDPNAQADVIIFLRGDWRP